MTFSLCTRIAAAALALMATAASAEPLPRELNAPPGKPVYIDFWAS